MSPDVVTPSLPAQDIDPNASSESTLDDKILQLLGDAPKTDIELVKPIHKEIAARWQNILCKGLQKDIQEKLLKEYAIPNNCDRLLAPIINAEIKAALPETLIKRDMGMSMKQKQIGIAIAALSQAMEAIINQQMSAETLLKPISDACRILCDTHFNNTKTRRGFVLSTINNNLKEAVTENERSKYLSGDDIAEKLKSAKSIQKSGEVLKQTPKPSVFHKSNSLAANNDKGRLNYKTLHRKQTPSNRFDAGKTRASREEQLEQSLLSTGAVSAPSVRAPAAPTTVPVAIQCTGFLF